MKILLVDDEPRILHTFARTLRLEGYAVTTAEDGERGLMLYHQEQPDLVLLDLRMPGMDGLEVLQAIREDDPEANVILFTAHGDKDAVIKALRAGASDFLPKPVDQVTLESALRRAEERIHLKRKLRASQEALRRHNERLEEEVEARTAELQKSKSLLDATGRMARVGGMGARQRDARGPLDRGDVSHPRGAAGSTAVSGRGDRLLPSRRPGTAVAGHRKGVG